MRKARTLSIDDQGEKRTRFINDRKIAIRRLLAGTEG